MKMGTHIKLPDGRVGTVVFNGLCGVGIKWGIHNPNPKDFENTAGDCPQDEPKLKPWPWAPDAFLREKCVEEVLDHECVGEEYEVLDD